MALLFELVCSVVGLALKPIVLSCQFVAGSIWFVAQTVLELLRFALCLHFIILWQIAIWIMAVLSLPVRAFTALYRERLLEIQLRRLKSEMEDALLDTKELEAQLHQTRNERTMMKMMLMELEQEHDEAILKIKQLQEELKNLKDESQRLKEVRGKSLWSYSDQDNMGTDYYTTGSDNLRKDEMLKPYKLSQLCMTSEEGILARQREVALFQSLFSVVLSLVVGFIILKAEDPCIPLVMALFFVVSSSLLSTLRLFTRIEHKPAAESVALLSLNWFILGALACPMLPRLARLLTPLASSFLQQKRLVALVSCNYN